MNNMSATTPPASALSESRHETSLQTIHLSPHLELHVASFSHPTSHRQSNCHGEVNTIPKFNPTQAPTNEIVKQHRFSGVRFEAVAIDGTHLLNFLKHQGKQLKKIELVDLSIRLDSADWDDDDDPYPFLDKLLQLLEQLEPESLEIKHLVCDAGKRPHSREMTHGEHKWNGTKKIRVGFASLIHQFREKRQKENMKVQEEARHSKPQSSFVEQESWDDEYSFGSDEESDEDSYIHEDDGEWDM